MPRIALVTALAARAIDPDLAPLEAALERAGAEPVIAAWDDPEFAWHEVDRAVIRSAWDYPQHIDRFLEWADRVDAVTRLHNPPPTIRWNADKHYLADLAHRGVPVVPTTFVEPGDHLPLPEHVDLVVKPAVSAGSRDTARFHPGDVAATRLAERILAEGRTVMLQPYQPAIDSVGETALVWFEGAFSHAFRKGPILRPGTPPTEALHAEEEIGPATPTDDEMRIAREVITATVDIVGGTPLYARIDLVPGDDGAPLLLELELIEPSVYHHVDPASADRFAAAILDRTPD